MGDEVSRRSGSPGGSRRARDADRSPGTLCRAERGRVAGCRGSGDDGSVDPQPILTPLTSAAIFLLVTIDPGREQQVREVLADFNGLSRSVGFREPEGALSCVVGIGSAAFDRLFGGPRPAGLHPFRSITGGRHVAVATPADLLFHIRARRMDLCFEFADQLTRRLAGAVTVVDEVSGFRYFDERDLLGFVDGTENPDGARGACRGADRGRGSAVRRRKLRDRAEVPAPDGRLGRAVHRGSGAGDRADQAVQHRAARRA